MCGLLHTLTYRAHTRLRHFAALPQTRTVGIAHTHHRILPALRTLPPANTFLGDVLKPVWWYDSLAIVGIIM